MRSMRLLPAHEEYSRAMLNYICGRVDEQQLIDACGSTQWSLLAEVHFQIALRHLADGDRRRARHHFEKSRDTYALTTDEFGWSQSYLRRMDRDPNWPAWIPMSAF